MTDVTSDRAGMPEAPGADARETTPRRLSPEAERALAEAAARRAAASQESRPKEIDGRKGPEPVRYGEWEVKGITVDF